MHILLAAARGQMKLCGNVLQTHKFHFPFVCGHQMVNHHFFQSAQWQGHCCWLPMFQIFHQGSPLNAVHSFFCHIEVFNNMVLLSKIPFVFLKFLFVSVYFNLSFYKLLILNIVAVHELKAKQKKKKSRLIYWNYSQKLFCFVPRSNISFQRR